MPHSYQPNNRHKVLVNQLKEFILCYHLQSENLTEEEKMPVLETLVEFFQDLASDSPELIAYLKEILKAYNNDNLS